MKNIKSGFTLIELLIVIALLGALAVGLLAALDPFEQLKKGTDTGTRNTVSEIQGAIIRYFALKQEMPWGPVSITNTPPMSDVSNLYNDVILPIVSTGELKQDFSALAGAQLANIFITGTNEAVTVCFRPTSKAFRNDPNTKYSINGSAYSADDAQTNCFSKVGDAYPTYDCYWCVK